MTWQNWESRPAFTTTSGRRVYPAYALGANGQRYEGGTIHVHDAEVCAEDIEFPAGLQHRIGFLTWNRNVIQYVEVNTDWRKQGIGREMLRLAREIAPTLLHAPCHQRSEDGEKFVRATDREQACEGRCGDGCRKPVADDEPNDVRPSGLWLRIKGALEPTRKRRTSR